MKVVKFKNGKYAIRRWRLFYQYLDPYARDEYGVSVWHNIPHPICQFDRLEDATKAAFRCLKTRRPDYGTPISINIQESK
jgi:hypothetical protein